MDALQERVASSTESMLLAPADVLQATPPPPPPPQPPPQVPLPSYGQHPVQPVLQQPEITVDMHTGGRIMCEHLRLHAASSLTSDCHTLST
eukprot:4413785-Amphidinium_carterae.1